MEFRKFGNTYVLRIEKGEEVVEKIKQFCKEQQVHLAEIRGIGATDDVTIGFFEVDKKEYHKKTFKGDYEITSLLGNVTTKDGEVYIHLHITFSDMDYKTYGGHLNAAMISATGEIIIKTIPGEVERDFSEEIGINLFRFN